MPRRICVIRGMYAAIKMLSKLFSLFHFFHRALFLPLSILLIFILSSLLHLFHIHSKKIRNPATMSSSSRNVVSPVPQRKARTNSSSSSVHQLTSLPSYSAPVCEASSITKLEIIEALSGKSGTKGVALSCSKDTLKTTLLPILQHQETSTN